MGKLSRQERIGAMVLAAIALLITGGAFLLRRGVPPASGTAVPRVQVIHIPDTAPNRQANDTAPDKGVASKGVKENRERSGKHHGKKRPQNNKEPYNRNPHNHNSGNHNPYNPFDPVPLKQEP